MGISQKKEERGERVPIKIDDREYGIILPRRDNKGKEISNSVLVNEAKKLAKQFGGANVDKIYGCWKDEDKPEANVTCEENITITTVRDSEDPPSWKKCQELAEEQDKDPRNPDWECPYSYKKQTRDDEEFMERRREDIQDQFSQALVFSSVSEMEAETSEYDSSKLGKTARDEVLGKKKEAEFIKWL